MDLTEPHLPVYTKDGRVALRIADLGAVTDPAGFPVRLYSPPGASGEPAELYADVPTTLIVVVDRNVRLAVRPLRSMPIEGDARRGQEVELRGGGPRDGHVRLGVDPPDEIPVVQSVAGPALLDGYEAKHGAPAPPHVGRYVLEAPSGRECPTYSWEPGA